MRSSDLAHLAGVTVRTLRHYHQLGLLDEPPRTTNGYREYSVHHLVRVLRIVRLASLGFRLGELAPMLDRDGKDTAEVLERLDDETAREIERLTERRALIAQLMAWNAAPDLPDAFAPHIALFAARLGDSTLARVDREQAILIGHLASPEVLDELAGLYARFSEPALLETSLTLTRRLADLDVDAPDSVVEAIVADMVATYGDVIRALRDDEVSFDPRAVALLAEYSNDSLNAAQRRVVERVEAALDTASPA